MRGVKAKVPIDTMKSAKSKKKRRSLAEYIKAHGCFLCYIPERAEIEEAKNRGEETNDIVNWLIDECGYNEDTVRSNRTRMAYHFYSHVRKANGEKK